MNSSITTPRLDDAAARALRDFGRLFLLAGGLARCVVDNAPLQPMVNAREIALYICGTRRHTWSADAVDAAAWREGLAAGLCATVGSTTDATMRRIALAGEHPMFTVRPAYPAANNDPRVIVNYFRSFKPPT